MTKLIFFGPTLEGAETVAGDLRWAGFEFRRFSSKKVRTKKRWKMLNNRTHGREKRTQ